MPNALLLREGSPCTLCVGRAVAWPGVVHSCYRDSRTESTVVAAMLALHRIRGTWRKDVDAYVCLTHFARTTLLQTGLPADRVYVKPNFLVDRPAVGDGPGRYLAFVGRLTPAKGVRMLMEAWPAVLEHHGGRPEPPQLAVVGDGPLTANVRSFGARYADSVTVYGRVAPSDVYRITAASTSRRCAVGMV